VRVLAAEFADAEAHFRWDKSPIPAVLSLGAEAYDYDVFLIGIGFRYFIGDRTPTLADEE
jgi:hypothetical protein